MPPEFGSTSFIGHAIVQTVINPPNTTNNSRQVRTDIGTVLAQSSFQLPISAVSVLTVLFLAGILCNILTIVVLRRRNARGARLLLYLSYVDVSFVTIVYVQTVLQNVVTPGSITSKVFQSLTPFLYPLMRSVLTTEVYITVLIAIQRALILSVPLKYIHLIRDSVFNRVLVGIILFAVVFNIPEWVNHHPELYWDGDLNVTWIKETKETIPSAHVYYYFKVLVDMLLPLALIIKCDVIMVISCVRSATIIGQEMQTYGRNQLTKIVVAITTVSLLLGLTVTCFYVVTMMDRSVLDTTEMYQHVGITAMLFSNAPMKFFFYCYFGSGFRETLLHLHKRNNARVNKEDTDEDETIIYDRKEEQDLETIYEFLREQTF